MLLPCSRLIFICGIWLASAHDVGIQQHVNDADSGKLHDAAFDHEAFLGSDQAAEFDLLPPAESKKRLEKMLPKIDQNNDTFVTRDELKGHIMLMAKKYVDEDIKRTWKYHPVENGKLSWGRYKRSVTGTEDDDDSKLMSEYREQIKKDSRRWPQADLDKDGLLDFDEWRCFQHPEDCRHMHSVLVDESVEGFDKNKDGKVDFKEYISDVFDPSEEEVKGEEPEWMQGERDSFNTWRDKNGDGVLDRDEVAKWLWPQDYDHSGIEADHLVSMADDNKDGKLTFKEIIEHYDVFVGSQVTQYGEHLKKHDPSEL